MQAFPLAGTLRRLRRSADRSQREFAEMIGVSKTAVAAAEAGTRDLPVAAFARAAAAVGGRLAVLDPDGHELTPMAEDAIRDEGGRLFPAHLDTRYGDEDWWHGPYRYARRQPTYTFDRDRRLRDSWRQVSGTPDDHQRPLPGDSPAERAAARRRAARQRADEERRARAAVAGPPPPDRGTGCTCPPGCEFTEDTNPDLAHATGCPCGCDVG